MQRKSNRSPTRIDAMTEQFGMGFEVFVGRCMMYSIQTTLPAGTRINVLL